ncbi:hypothetical protein SLA2020_096240 [Shorea laevis]
MSMLGVVRKCHAVAAVSGVDETRASWGSVFSHRTVSCVGVGGMLTVEEVGLDVALLSGPSGHLGRWWTCPDMLRRHGRGYWALSMGFKAL